MVFFSFDSFGRTQVLGIVLSLFVIYRLVSATRRPLSKVPGPWYTKYTNMVVKYQWLKGKKVEYVHGLHEKYGPTVRVGPNEVHTTDITAIRTIFSVKEGYLKDWWYETIQFPGFRSMFSTTDPAFHRNHRRLLQGPLSESSLQIFLPWIDKKVTLALSRIQEEMERQGVVDVLKWFLFMATDIIGELSFGGDSFRMLEIGKKNQYITELEREGGLFVAMRTTFPFLARYLHFLPLPVLQESLRASANERSYAEASIARYRRLLEEDPDNVKPTLFTKVWKAADEGSLTPNQIRDQAMEYIVAGSDTTANTLTALVYFVCRNPDVRERLLMEFATLGPDFTDRELKRLPFLQCVVEETLRLAAPIPAALPRVVPPGGASLDGYWLPGGSIVSTVPWSVHRMDSIFPDARRFIPSRWENPTKDMKDGFLAFGGGVRTCVGMHLSRIELRVAAAKFFLKYPKAKVSTKDGFSDAEMEQDIYFLAHFKGNRLLLELR